MRKKKVSEIPFTLLFKIKSILGGMKINIKDKIIKHLGVTLGKYLWIGNNKTIDTKGQNKENTDYILQLHKIIVVY